MIVTKINKIMELKKNQAKVLVTYAIDKEIMRNIEELSRKYKITREHWNCILEECLKGIIEDEKENPPPIYSDMEIPGYKEIIINLDK